MHVRVHVYLYTPLLSSHPSGPPEATEWGGRCAELTQQTLTAARARASQATLRQVRTVTVVRTLWIYDSQYSQTLHVHVPPLIHCRCACIYMHARVHVRVDQTERYTRVAIKPKWCQRLFVLHPVDNSVFGTT